MSARGARRGRRVSAAVAVCLGLTAALLMQLAAGSDRPGESGSSASPRAIAQSPNPSNTGVSADWVPARTQAHDMVVAQPGAVIEDTRFTEGARLTITAENVTVRNSEFQGGGIRTDGYRGVVIEDVTINRRHAEAGASEGAISYCNYTAVRVKIVDRSEGFRESCEPGATTTIRDSFIRITPPADCIDWHGDGIQGYGGVNLHVSNVTIDFHERPDCAGTSPFFYVGGSGGSPHGKVDVDGLLLKGGGYSFRLGTPGRVRGLKIVDGSWRYAPVDITDAGCGAIVPWDVSIVDVDDDWQVTRTVRRVPCPTGST